MNKEIIIRGRKNSVDIALLEDSKLLEIVSSNNDTNFAVGDIYLAKIKKMFWRKMVTPLHPTNKRKAKHSASPFVIQICKGFWVFQNSVFLN